MMQKYFLLFIPGRNPVKLTASTQEHLARLITHRDIGASVARTFAREAWALPFNQKTPDVRGTRLMRVKGEGE